jgi:hypothetical protein
MPPGVLTWSRPIVNLAQERSEHDKKEKVALGFA